MTPRKYILSIDQGTTSTRALLVDHQGRVVTSAQKAFQQYFPKNGWVEHDPTEIWETTHDVCQTAINTAGGAKNIRAIGITNQRETTLVWDKKTGEPIYPAIVWQDRRTATDCQQFKAAGHQMDIQQKTGLLLDPYFSATKLRWLLDNVKDARKRAAQGELLFGTIDSFLIWRLTGGRSHVTDVTNASRTLLFNLKTLSWDESLCALFDIPLTVLPKVLDNCDNFGDTTKALFGRSIPITGVAGDQQAAAFGQACFRPGMVKSTYGTGCFVLLNTGEEPCHSNNHLLTTVLSRINGKVNYALEGSIFIAGAAVKWLHEKLHLIESPAETENLARSLSSNEGVYLVPAFTGLGAPYWEPNARASLFGMTRDTGRAAIARATLESVCYQTRDLLTLMQQDGATLNCLRVDGGMTDNAWFLQYLADCLGTEVAKPVCRETTALGAAFFAGLQCGFYDSLATLEALWQCEHALTPDIKNDVRSNYQQWQKAVAATLSFSCKVD